MSAASLPFHSFSQFRTFGSGVLILLLILGQGVLAKAQSNAPDAAEIDRLAQMALDSFKVPGFSIGVISEGKVLILKGYGVRELGKPAKVDAQTQFAIASNTKAFVGTAMAILASENKLSLEDSVQQYLPEMRWASDAITRQANVTDLLTHRTGLGTFEGDHFWFKREVSVSQVLTKVALLPLRYPFRAGYGYSNVGFIAAGELIKRVEQKPWHQVVSERILQPLGMSRTLHDVRSFPDQNHASGHITRQQNMPISAVAWDASGAAGGLWSSAEDMTRWLEVQLGKGMFRGDTIWPESVARQVMKPHNTFGNHETFSSYGLGWFMYKKGEATVFTHGGGYDGMYSQTMWIPSLGVGMVILTNGMTPLAGALNGHLRDRFLGVAEPGNEWLQKAMDQMREGDREWFARQDSVEMRLGAQQGKPHRFADLSGRYADAGMGIFEIKAIADQPGNYQLTIPQGRLLGARLQPVGADHYRIVWREPHAWFDKGMAFFEEGAQGQPVLRLYIPNDDIFYDTVRGVRE